MKRLLIGTLAVIMFASPFALLHAENATTSTSSKPGRGWEDRGIRDGWREKMMFGNRMEGLKEKMQERRDEMHTRFDSNRAEVITNILNRIEERFQRAIDRMADFATRIQERIDLVKDNGGSTGDAQAFLDDAVENIDKAQKAFDDIDLDGAVATPTPSTVLQGVREELQAVRDLLKTAHQNLADAIRSLKGRLSTSSDDDSN